jgi:hypothetical protein
MALEQYTINRTYGRKTWKINIRDLNEPSEQNLKDLARMLVRLTTLPRPQEEAQKALEPIQQPA